MKQWIYALILRIPFTIDRIEDQWVIVEWANMALSTIWKGHFPDNPREGEKGMAKLWLCKDPKIEIIARDPLTIKDKAGTSVIPYPFGTSALCLQFEREEDNALGSNAKN